jgi:hypothetical protein
MLDTPAADLLALELRIAVKEALVSRMKFYKSYPDLTQPQYLERLETLSDIVTKTPFPALSKCVQLMEASIETNGN